MNKQQIQRVLGNLWFWLGISLLLIVAVLAIQNVSQRKAAALIPNTGAGAAVQAQTVPDASAQGVANYINAHNSGSSAQAVPDASVQSVSDYLNAHSGTQGQAVPEAAVQGVMDYLRAHGVK